MQDEDLDNESIDTSDIAVVGLACRLPGANTPQQYWDNLKNGVESVTTLDDDALKAEGVSDDLIKNPNYVKRAAILDDMEGFDAGFFNFSPLEATMMDPQHRHFLECSWEALESAGYDPSRFDGAIGLFAGSGHNAYMPNNLFTNPQFMNQHGMFLVRHTGNDKDFLTTRASYCFDLKGPSVNVQTACSTSLVAIHMAVQSLMSHESDIALAGGVTIEMPHRRGYLFQEGEILSPDGHCRAFDASSKGTVFGSGAGVVVLKRLEDALDDGDTIHALIKSSAVNNDGSGKVSYMAPSVDGQAAAVHEALTVAEIDPETIDYVECHGTGTPIGDPIEITALTTAYKQETKEKQFCKVGSVKSNIGHLDTAAGTAGLIKVVESLKNKQIPPSINFSEHNPAIDWQNSPFSVNEKLIDWEPKKGPRRGAVSALGVGGTNAHIILEEAPELDETSEAKSEQLFLLSAKTKSALEQKAQQLAAHIESKVQ
ncbi:MAG: polyketide synthase, partial [Pseudomonadales bacterium]|nr:polyketide synthase [Pseudomonadales bacterium]